MNENTRVSSRDYSLGGQQVEEAARPVSQAMSELASTIGDLETAARALAGRISSLLPSGSPFERAEKPTSVGQAGQLAAPKPVRSHHCDELHQRIYALSQITGSINEMVKGIEL